MEGCRTIEDRGFEGGAREPWTPARGSQVMESTSLGGFIYSSLFVRMKHREMKD